MKKLCVIILLVLSSVLYAQEQTITGTLYNERGLPLIGATVLIDGTSIGVISDFDGNFTIKVPAPAAKKSLKITTLGYKMKIVAIGAKRQFKISLEPDAEALDEVVVVGYGTVKKSDLTGSVSSIKAEDITKTGAIGIEQALAGRASGVVVSQGSGAPGSGASIKIRGISSLNGSDPLYIIDGTPMDNTSAGSLSGQDQASAAISPLSMLNPADIESIEVLKDASSTAIYGSRGANGVVLITTKGGKEGKGVITVDHDFSILEIPNFIDLLDANQYTILNEEAYVNAGEPIRNQVRLDSANLGLLQTSDWQKTIIRAGTSSNTNVNFSGGNKDLRYLISTNVLDAKGIVEKTDYKRIGNRVNLDANISDKIKVGTRISYTHVTSNQRAISTGSNNLRGASSAISRALRSAPTSNLDADSEDEGVDLWTPILAINANDFNNLLTQYSGSLFFDYSFNKALSFKTNLTHQARNIAQRYYQYNILPNDVAEGGRAKTGDSRFTRSTITNTLNYRKRFGKHNLNVLLGESLEFTEMESVYVSNYGFANDLLTYYAPGSATFYDPDRVTYSDNRLSSFFGRINYNYKGKYLLTLTGRFDGSSKFAANNKWAFFPAAALAYKINEESFMKEIDAISELKLRLSYGVSGNQAIQPYQSLDQYGSGQTGFGNGSGGEMLSTIYFATQLPNKDLTWETTAQFDAGLDYSLFDNRITGSFEYYRKISEDILFANNRIPSQSGFSTYTQNYGSLETNGFEMSVNAHAISTVDFTWTIGANLSTGKTKVRDMAADYVLSGWDPGYISGGTQRLIIGEEIGSFYGYKQSGIAQFEDFVEFQGLTKEQQITKYNAAPNDAYTFVNDFKGGVPRNASVARPGEQLYEDLNNDGVLNENDRKVIGTAQPDLTFGINNSFKYKNLDISFFVDSQIGRDIANIQNLDLLRFSSRQGLALAMERWTPENPSTTYPRVDLANGSFSPLFSDRVVEDASFVRLQNITLGYSFPKSVTAKLNINNLRVFGSISNVYTWTNYTGYHPDVSLNGSAATSMGHDNGGYPLARTIRMGVSVKF
ncbi:hypothetical protein AXE80_08875 [Wenyingzhuangia fucanilytica]|uniref:SusC/RagA family TonB-linked outer membrane protein n=1 Tax=Wenyingzhuangia fucanilytica TaxID=1790137 RepID=A0A1B1Y6J0_9FLAO|nr:TonB-dependent receptor [Wenyingzhuangia fucanilytica]ANW96383.1 hypothetical protein AXE80_08875 [Wenyingzhuangia fucanilytica]